MYEMDFAIYFSAEVQSHKGETIDIKLLFSWIFLAVNWLFWTTDGVQQISKEKEELAYKRDEIIRQSSPHSHCQWCE